MYSYFITALFTIPKTQNQPKCPSVADWIKEMWYIYTMEYYAAMKKKNFMSFPPASTSRGASGNL